MFCSALPYYWDSVSCYLSGNVCFCVPAVLLFSSLINVCAQVCSDLKWVQCFAITRCALYEPLWHPGSLIHASGTNMKNNAHTHDVRHSVCDILCIDQQTENVLLYPCKLYFVYLNATMTVGKMWILQFS